MIHICIPVHNEAATIGPLLWKIRKTFTDPEFRRDFRVIVFDDGSTDGTAEALQRYDKALPLTVLRSTKQLGYGVAVDRLLRHVVDDCAYPKRDPVLVMQADFTEEPASAAQLVRIVEGGADIVGSHEDEASAGARPKGLRWARRAVPWVLGGAHRRAPVADPLNGFRAYRVIVVKKALRENPETSLCTATEPWAANLELLARLVPHARRIEDIETNVRHASRSRASRFEAMPTLKVLWRMRRSIGWPTVAGLLLLGLGLGLTGGGLPLGPGPAGAQELDSIAPPTLGSATPLGLALPDSLEAMAAPERPFAVGEHLTYRVKLGIFNVGAGDMSVHGVDTIRGIPSYHVSMGLNASAFFGAAKVKDRFESWMDTRTMASRRFIRDIHEVNYKSYRVFEIYPDERRWERTDESDDKTGETLSSLPMDEIAFIYWIRTQELEVGETYTYDDRYFKEEGNPVTLKVLRRETKTVDAGTFETIVVQPIINTSGLFSEGGNAELYFTDDEHRLMVYMRSEVPVVGSITLHLQGVEGVPGYDARLASER